MTCNKIKVQSKEDLKKIISNTIKEQGNTCDLNFIDISKLTDLSYTFHNSEFNGNISDWNVSSVTNMHGMF